MRKCFTHAGLATLFNYRMNNPTLNCIPTVELSRIAPILWLDDTSSPASPP